MKKFQNENTETPGSIQTKMELDTIQLKGLRWRCKMIVNETLPKAHRNYKVELTLDEEPYLKRIDEVQAEFDATLFSRDQKSRATNDKNIQKMKDSLEKLRKETEEIKFIAIVEELKYRDANTVLVMIIPDDVIEPFNRQKTRFDIYKLTLIPISY